MSEYIIQDETLTGIGDQVRRLAGTEAIMTPAQMKTALESVPVGGSSTGGSAQVCDEFKIANNFIDPSTELGGSGNEISPDENGSKLYGLDYFATFSRTPAITDFYELPPQLDYLEIKLPECTSINGSSISVSNLVSIELPSCLVIPADSPLHYSDYLERAVLNTACSIGSNAFPTRYVDQSTPILKVYLIGDTVGTCDEDAFGYITNYEERDENDTIIGYNIPKLEIYVPSALINDFKTTWANGVYANNIFSLPDDGE